MLLLQSAPHLALQQYIGQYFYISFHSGELPSLKQAFLPYDIPTLILFVGPVFLEHTGQENTGRVKVSCLPGITPLFVGLVTSPINLYFGKNQIIKGFMAVFKPAGFSALFRRDMAELTDQIPDFSWLVGVAEAALYSEQLLTAPDFAAQVKIMNAFFLKRISGRQPQAAQIAEACRRLNLSNGLERMTDLAYHTNMSLRNLERQFTERVGITPKTFARFKRLHRALSFLSHPQPPSWANIALECGYYDQAHFIKEFKALTHHTPSVFSPSEYLLYNQFILFPQFSTF